jgi:flotillin
MFEMLAVFGVGGLLLTLLAYKIVTLRRVVSTNEVHIVQSRKTTLSYGKDTGNGNTYYEWPSWLPLFGVTKIKLPVSVFDLDLVAYEAYDKGRLPFVIDVKAFFRISDSNIAAQRVASFDELLGQLKAIVQGAVRTILASNDIETIMQGRATFGVQFTHEVAGQLVNWGVSTVKNIELMDIHDSRDSHVIRNIMEKKKSFIEMESRTEVAKNHKMAEMAEIEAAREVDLQKQSAKQSVGLRTIEADRQVTISRQEALQTVAEQEKVTKEKEMNVLSVLEVRKAEIQKNVQIVQAQQQKETTVLVAEGKLEEARRQAEAVTLNGEAKASAEKALQLAPVEAQIVLAKEIGANESYQKYLVTIRQVEAGEAVGMEQAKALEKADIKIISNTGAGPGSGLNNVRDLFSSEGGMKVGAMLEGLAATDKGQAVLKALNVTETKNVA